MEDKTDAMRIHLDFVTRHLDRYSNLELVKATGFLIHFNFSKYPDAHKWKKIISNEIIKRKIEDAIEKDLKEYEENIASATALGLGERFGRNESDSEKSFDKYVSSTKTPTDIKNEKNISTLFSKIKKLEKQLKQQQKTNDGKINFVKKADGTYSLVGTANMSTPVSVPYFASIYQEVAKPK